MDEVVFIWPANNQVIGPISTTNATQIEEKIEAKFKLVLDSSLLASSRDFLPRAAMVVTTTRAAILPALRVGEPKNLLAVQETVGVHTARWTLFIASEGQSLTHPDYRISLADLTGLILRASQSGSLRGEEVLEVVWHDLHTANHTLYASYYKNFAESFSRLDDVANPARIGMLMTELQDLRSAYAYYMLEERRHHVGSLGQLGQPQAMIQGLDGLATSLGIRQMAALNAGNRESRRALENAQAEEGEKDRMLVKLATVLLLPTLWFSFLGTNIFPDMILGLYVASLMTTILSAVVALLLSAAGLGLVIIIYKRRDKKSGRT